MPVICMLSLHLDILVFKLHASPFLLLASQQPLRRSLQFLLSKNDFTRPARPQDHSIPLDAASIFRIVTVLS